MSGSPQRAYIFKTLEQWEQCLLDRFDPVADGSLAPTVRLGKYVTLLKPSIPIQGARTLAMDPYGQPILLGDSSGPLGQSPRLVADREWLWSFDPSGTVVRRAGLDTFQTDLEIDVQLRVRDIAGDGHQGIWVLCGDSQLFLIHFDCQGRPRERHAAPYEATTATQMASTQQGLELALLAQDAKTLVFVNAATGLTERSKNLSNLAPGWQVTELTSDTQARVALWGIQASASGPQGVLFVFDATGDLLDGPISGMFDQPGSTQPPPPLDSVRIGVYREAVWFATGAGLWRLDSSEASSPRESESYLTTPALFSPATGADRGWLRAEASLDLVQGGALDVSVATTNDPKLRDAVQAIFDDVTKSPEQRRAAVWDRLEAEANFSHSTIPGPAQMAFPLAIPILEPEDQWLWMRVSVITPPGSPPAPLRELRVLYPNLSIVNSLPAIFRGTKNDPTGALRSLAGVLESTTQHLDRRIRDAASYLDARNTPPEWLNYLARWFDLPWDDGLPVDSKRRVLERAGELLDARGTRSGLLALLQSLAGPDSKIEVVDRTADYSLLRLGGGGQKGAALPGLLAGTSLLTPTLGGKAVLGRARLCVSANDPLSEIAPVLRIGITATAEVRRSLETLLRRVLLQYVPAGIAIAIRWTDSALADPGVIGENGIVIGGLEVAALGKGSTVGQSTIGGRNRARIGEMGFEMGNLQ